MKAYIVILDDDKDVLFSVKMLLKHLSYPVKTFSTPDTAKKFIVTFVPKFTLKHLHCNASSGKTIWQGRRLYWNYPPTSPAPPS